MCGPRFVRSTLLQTAIMSNNEISDQIVQRVADEARRAASDLPFDERANLVRSVARAVADAIKASSW